MSYHQCHLISAGLSGNKATWRSIGWPIQSEISPPNNTIKTVKFVRFSNQKQRKNNISFPPQKKWDLHLCLIPRLIKVQKPRLIMRLDPSPKVFITKNSFCSTHWQTTRQDKTTWAVPTGAGAGFTSPSWWNEITCGGYRWFHDQTSADAMRRKHVGKHLCDLSPYRTSAANHPCRLEEEILQKGLNLAMQWTNES